MTFLGLGDGFDESLTWNYDDFDTRVRLTTASAVEALTYDGIHVEIIDDVAPAGTVLLDTWFTNFSPLAIQTDGNADFGAAWLGLGNHGSGVAISIAKSRSTDGDANAIVVNGDDIAYLIFEGDDGNGSMLSAVEISAAVDGVPGTNDMPGRLQFATTADGASASTERMRIDSAGNVGIGNTAPVRMLDVARVINAASISASESYKTGLGTSSDVDGDHDVNTAAGAAQSFDTTHDIVLAAEITKRLDEAWSAGNDAGGLGVPDLTAAIVLTFDRTANPDTITAGSGTPWATCNANAVETGTIVINGGSTNDGIYEVASCTDTVLTLGNDVLVGDETGGSGEYEARYLEPNVWMHFFLIELAGTEDACFDTSEIATNCLSESSYDQYRLLQSVFLNAIGNII